MIARFIGGPKDGETCAIREPLPVIKVMRPADPMWLHQLSDPGDMIPLDHDTYRLAQHGPGVANYEWEPWICSTM